MSTGAISQLVSRGHINKFLNSNPQISFYRFQSMRHTHFALESQAVQFQGTGLVGSTNTVRISRSGDLVYHIYAVIDLPGIANVTTTVATSTDGGAGYTGSYMEVVQSTSHVATYQSMGGGAGAALPEANCIRTINGVQDPVYDGEGVPFYTNAVGQYLVQKASVRIGSQNVDTLFGEYMFMLEELNGKPGKELKAMIGKHDTVAELKAASKMFQRLYVPLPWFFTTNSGSALPLVSLQFHDVQIEITWNSIANSICNSSGLSGRGTISVSESGASDGTVGGGANFTTSAAKVHALRTVVRPLEDRMNQRQNGAISVWGASSGTNTNTTLPSAIANSDVSVHLEICYVFLGKEERQRFAEGSFEMLMTELQSMSALTGQQTTSISQSLDFNHAVACIYWATRQVYHEQRNEWFSYKGLQEPVTGLDTDPIQTVMIKINNQERVQLTEGRYYRTVQPYQHMRKIPEKCFIYSYSFGLEPHEAQPSGSCNFSRIDNSKLDITVDRYMFSDNTAQGGLNLSATDSTYVPSGGAAAVPLVPGGNSISLMVYARSYNILRVTLGLAGKAFAN